MDKSKKAIIDVLYCIFSVGMMNAVLQFFVYPVINIKLGEVVFGEILFLIGVMNILAPSFGSGTGNTRLVFPKQDEAKNRDYVNVVSIFVIIAMLITFIVMKTGNYGLFDIISFAIIVGIGIFRYYAFVEYRLTLNYGKQFYFYLILSVGYIVGTVIFYFTGIWQVIFLLGELFAVLYVLFTGSIFKDLAQKTEYQKNILKDSTTLSCSYLLSNGMSNLDKIILIYLVDAVAVSEYYVISLIGKIIFLISGPVTSVLIGNIAKYGTAKAKKLFNKILFLTSVGGIILFLGCVIVTPVFIKILYPTLYDKVIYLNVVVNAGQILYFLTLIILTVLLTFVGKEKQLLITGLYSVVFIILALIGTKLNGLEGFAYATLISNVLYFMGTTFVGIYYSRTIDNT